MATIAANIILLALLLAALCTGQAPPQHSAVPVSHFGPTPGPTQCFNQGLVLHVDAQRRLSGSELAPTPLAEVDAGPGQHIL